MSRYLDQLGPEGIVITKHGKPVANLIPIQTESAALIGSLAGKIRVHGDLGPGLPPRASLPVRCRRDIGYNAVLSQEKHMATSSIEKVTASSITSDQALKIARLDAERVYRDLSPYRASVFLEPDGWHVEYELKDPDLQGGGPRYVIAPGDGEILTKQYQQ